MVESILNNNPYEGYRPLKKWLEALDFVVCENDNVEDHINFYSSMNIPRNELDENLIKEITSQILFSCSYLSTIKDTNNNLTEAIVKSNMINWYYSIYHAAKVMITTKKQENSPETHSKTAKMWDDIFAKNKLIQEPFSYRYSSLVESKRKKEFKELGLVSFRIGDHKNANIENVEMAKNACYAKLNGEHKWLREQKESNMKSSREFKDKGWTDFQQREAWQFRDEKLKKNGGVGFLHCAAGFRGSVNYRNITSFMYKHEGNYYKQHQQNINKYLITISEGFIKCMLAYCKKGIKKDQWNRVIDDLDKNSYINNDIKETLKEFKNI